jgi:glycosyltransferase involved in cell wall biosynthesis
LNSLQDKVSIILPTYNRAKYIHKSIESCLNQTYNNIELVVVDDGSADNTKEAVASCKDPRIKYIRHEKNLNLPNALNTGFAAASGAYLTWTSDDNYFAPEAVEAMHEFLVENKHDFVYCDIFLFGNDKEGFIKDGVIKKHKEPDNFLPDKNTGIGPCFMYSRKVMEKTGSYDTEAFLAEDYDYWIRVSRNFKLYHLNKHLYYFRLHNESLFDSRYPEVKATTALVNIKNGISNPEELSRMLLKQLAAKYAFNSWAGRIPLLVKLRALLYERYFRRTALNDIKNILSEFKDKKHDLKASKLEIMKALGLK